MLDAADAAEPGWLAGARAALLDGGGSDNAGTVVIRHIERLDGVHLRSLAGALQEAANATKQQAASGEKPQAPWVAVTVGPGVASKELARLLRLFPSTVEVPPLRHHIEDLQTLVPFFVARLGYGGQLACSPEVLQMLMRSNWPGNVEQVLQTMRLIVQHRRTGTIRRATCHPRSGRSAAGC